MKGEQPMPVSFLPTTYPWSDTSLDLQLVKLSDEALRSRLYLLHPAMLSPVATENLRIANMISQDNNLWWRVKEYIVSGGYGRGVEYEQVYQLSNFLRVSLLQSVLKIEAALSIRDLVVKLKPVFASIRDNKRCIENKQRGMDYAVRYFNESRASSLNVEIAQLVSENQDLSGQAFQCIREVIFQLRGERERWIYEDGHDILLELDGLYYTEALFSAVIEGLVSPTELGDLITWQPKRTQQSKPTDFCLSNPLLIYALRYGEVKLDELKTRHKVDADKLKMKLELLDPTNPANQSSLLARGRSLLWEW
tara:strand:+ start:4952 stop:5875 length:924 start_codon:yes stop_codon:yes gene_type:complete